MSVLGLNSSQFAVPGFSTLLITHTTPKSYDEKLPMALKHYKNSDFSLLWEQNCSRTPQEDSWEIVLKRALKRLLWSPPSTPFLFPYLAPSFLLLMKILSPGFKGKPQLPHFKSPPCLDLHTLYCFCPTCFPTHLMAQSWPCGHSF